MTAGSGFVPVVDDHLVNRLAAVPGLESHLACSWIGSGGPTRSVLPLARVRLAALHRISPGSVRPDRMAARAPGGCLSRRWGKGPAQQGCGGRERV
jgi:hypothetical protein